MEADNHDIAEPALRIEALVRINHELAEEVDRLNRVIQVLTGPEVQRRSRVLVWRQGRTRSLEKILSAVAEMER